MPRLKGVHEKSLTILAILARGSKKRRRDPRPPSVQDSQFILRRDGQVIIKKAVPRSAGLESEWNCEAGFLTEPGPGICSLNELDFVKVPDLRIEDKGKTTRLKKGPHLAIRSDLSICLGLLSVFRAIYFVRVSQRCGRATKRNGRNSAWKCPLPPVLSWHMWYD